MLKVPMYVKSIIREWRSGELTLLFLALILAVTCISAMNNFTDKVKDQLERNAANLLGADAVLTSNTPIPSAWIKKADELKIQQINSLAFQSMVSYQEHLELAQIKAIPNLYPLRGTLKIAKQLTDGGGDALTHAPDPGTVWISPRLIPSLATQIGQNITIGARSFQVAGIIREEPGQTGNWFTFSPSILMNSMDVEKTKIIQPGSILTYHWLLNGSQPQLNALHAVLQKQFNERQQWRDSQNNIQTVTNTITRTLNYLNFATLMSLVFAGVAISMASLGYCQRHVKQVALLRCFGASQNQIMRLYLSSLALLGIIACLIGAALGYALQPLLLKWLGGLLPNTEQQLTVWPFLLSILTGMLLLFCFSTANLWQLHKVSAITLFRQYQLSWGNNTYFIYGLALLLLGVMAYCYTNSFKITFVVLVGCLVFVTVAVGGLWLFFGLLVKTKIHIPLNLRFAVNNIARSMEDSALQVVGIGLALTTLLSLMILKNHMISDWLEQLPPKTPNYFVFNIEPGQINTINTVLKKHHVAAQVFYPIVRGRLSAINNIAVTQLFGEEAKNINALQRELNLSWTKEPPPGNKITEGSWSVSDANEAWVSVEKDLAAKLKLKLGDSLRFNIEGRDVNVIVRSMRQVDWNTFKPNFFMLLKPGLLDAWPKTMLTSFYLPEGRQEVLIDIIKEIPNASVIDIAQTINKVQSILNSAGSAISFITFFALMIGLIIVALSLLALSGNKKQETKVLKILGMRRKSLLWIRSSEAFMIGLYAGILATISALLINAYLAQMVLDSQYSIQWGLLVIVPVATAFFVVFINWIIQRRQYQG